MRLKKIVEAEDAVAVIHDGDVIAEGSPGGRSIRKSSARPSDPPHDASGSLR